MAQLNVQSDDLASVLAEDAKIRFAGHVYNAKNEPVARVIHFFNSTTGQVTDNAVEFLGSTISSAVDGSFEIIVNGSPDDICTVIGVGIDGERDQILGKIKGIEVIE